MTQLGYPRVSGDSHLEVDWKYWNERVPKQFRAVFDTRPCPLSLGRWKEADKVTGPGYLEASGTGPPQQRVEEQDQDGLAAEVMFPAVHGPRTWRAMTEDDDEAYLSIVRAYNTWLAEDYCSVARNRLIGIGVLPWTGVDDCIVEMERCAKLGLRTVVLGTFPSGRGYPTAEDDRFWQAALGLRMPITIHVNLDRTGPRDGPLFEYPVVSNASRHRIVEEVTNRKFCLMGAVNAAQLVFSGVFDRLPDLHIDFAENQIGWIPHFYEQADERYERHRKLAERDQGLPPLQRLPSEYMREHCYWGFQANRIGVEMRHHLSVDRVIWASDFPHQESNWPDSMQTVEKNFTGVPEDETYKMVCGNVVEFFHLEDCLPTWEASVEGRMS
jgi:predicted TIM-barrel fold metal-dependent hydrolase